MKAAFAAGCFWGVEDAFMALPGVTKTEVGYAGGPSALRSDSGQASSGQAPTYEEVCTGKTGHAETLELEYDPAQISYETLLKKFWEIHDPTTLNRQGPDIGSQYRSVIFYYTPEQKAAAEQSKTDEISRYARNDKRVVTEIVPMDKFWPAEEYHQKYFLKNGGGTCRV